MKCAIMYILMCLKSTVASRSYFKDLAATIAYFNKGHEIKKIKGQTRSLDLDFGAWGLLYVGLNNSQRKVIRRCYEEGLK